jgi:hypothetical protein
MKKLYISFVILAVCISLSHSQKINPSYRYVAGPGFVNITELTGAMAVTDTIGDRFGGHYFSDTYFGITNIFGYQINRNFFGGIGTGLYIYGDQLQIPLFLEYKYSAYLRRITPFVYADGGAITAPADFRREMKIFINPGIGFSVPVSSKLECNFSAGFLVQTRSIVTRAGYLNFRIGITYRKNSFRLFKPARWLMDGYY